MSVSVQEQSHREAWVLKERKLEEDWLTVASSSIWRSDHHRRTHRETVFSPYLWNPIHSTEEEKTQGILTGSSVTAEMQACLPIDGHIEKLDFSVSMEPSSQLDKWQVPFCAEQKEYPSVQTESCSTILKEVSIHPSDHLKIGSTDYCLIKRHETVQAADGPARTTLLSMLQDGDHTLRGPLNRRSQKSDLIVRCDDEVALSLNQDLHQVSDEISNQSRTKDLKDTKDCVRGLKSTMISGIASLVPSCRSEKDSARGETIRSVFFVKLLQLSNDVCYKRYITLTPNSLSVEFLAQTLILWRPYFKWLSLEMFFLHSFYKSQVESSSCKCCPLATCPCRHAVMIRRAWSAGQVLLFFRAKLEALGGGTPELSVTHNVLVFSCTTCHAIDEEARIQSWAYDRLEDRF